MEYSKQDWNLFKSKIFDLVALLHDGAIEMEDLEEFSEEVREMVKRFM